MKKERIIWGLLFIIGGIFLIVKNLGFLSDVNIFSLLLSVFLVYVIVKSIVKLNFVGILFPLAFLFMIYDEPLGFPKLSPLILLLSATLASIGFSIIFKKDNFKYNKLISYNDNNIIEYDFEDESHIKQKTSFGSSVRYINSNNFINANLNCSFGAMSVYFNNSKMQNETAVINLNASFSGVELYIPKEWEVEDKTNSSFSGIEVHNRSDLEKTNTLILVGDITFSGVEIFYV